MGVFDKFGIIRLIRQKKDKFITLFLLIFYSLFALTIIGKNIYDTFNPPTLGIPGGAKIDVESVKRKIQEAELKPKEAMYYKVLDKQP